MVVVFPVLFVAVLVAALSDRKADPLGVVFVMVVFALLAVGALIPLRSWITADDIGIVVRNPLSVHDLPYREIVTCTPGYWGLKFVTRTRGVTAVAVQRPNWSTWLGTESRADRVARLIEERSDAARQ